MTELKPCPFCGSKDVHILTRTGDEGYNVYCFKCGSKGTWSEDPAKCITGWNSRAVAPFAASIIDDMQVICSKLRNIVRQLEQVSRYD